MKISNNELIIKSRNPHKIAEVIPCAEFVSEHEIKVPFALDTCSVLRNIGVKNVPNPIEHQYKWAGLYSPFSHQIETAIFLTTHRKCFCLNEMGTGKTMSCLWAIDFLMQVGQIKKTLILCPLSIMESAWGGDAFNCITHRNVVVAYGATAEKKRKLAQSDADIIITNIDSVIPLSDIIKDFDLVIVDEANSLKSTSTQRWKTFSKALNPQSRLWLLTGSPCAQSPLDAYGLAKLVNPNSVPKYFGAFRDMVMRKVTAFKWVPKQEATAIVHQILQPAIRFMKSECLDLPERTYITRNVPLTVQQTKYYELLRKKMVTTVADEAISTVNQAAALTKLLQISGGAVYSDTKETIEFDVTNRMEELIDIINETTEKVLVFVSFTHTIELLREKLAAGKISCEVINGQVASANRARIFKAFQETEEPKVLLIQPKAAAHGITLTRANTVVWWSPPMSSEVYIQANDRIHRPGQRNACTVVHLSGSYVERKLYKMLQSNLSIHTSITDLYKNVLKETK